MTPIALPKEPEALLRFLFDFSPVPMIMSRIADGTILRANQAFADSIGAPLESLIGQNSADLYVDHKVRPRLVKELREQGHLSKREAQIRDSQGNVRSIVMDARMILQDGEEVILAGWTDITNCKRVEQSLQAGEERYREIIENQGEGILIADLNEAILFANPAADEMFGVVRGTLIGRLLQEFLSESQQDVLRQQTERRKKGEKSVYELELRRPDQEIRHVLVSGSPRRNKLGQIVGSFGVFRDITDRKRAEEALRETEERWRRLTEHNPTCMVVHCEGNIVYANTAAVRLLRADSLHQLVGKPAISFVHPDSRSAAIQRIGCIMAEDVPAEPYEEKFVRLDGDVVHVEVTGIPITYAAKKAVLTVCWDVTERRRAEELLRENEERFRLLSENAGDVIWRLRLDTMQMTYVSPSVQRLHGYTPEETLQIPIKDILTTESYERVMALLPQRLAAFAAGDESARVRTDEIDQIRKDGTIIPTEIVTTFVTDDTGTPVEIIGSTRDITERRQVELALRRQNDYLTALRETTLDLATEHDFDRLLERIILRAGELIGTTSGWLDLLEPGANRMTPRVALGALATESPKFAVQKGEGISGKVWQSGRPMAVADYDTWGGRIPNHQHGLIRSIMAVPLISQGAVQGVLGLAFDRESERTFDADAMNVLSQFARMATLAIENARLISVAQRELTERKRAMEALQSSEQMLSSIYSNVSVVLFSLSVEPDERFRFLSVNQPFLKATGLSETAVVGKYVEEVIPEPSLTLVLGKYREALRHKATVRWEEVTDYPAGRKFGDVAATPILDVDGRCTMLIGSVHDVTERRQAEEALRESEERFRQVAESAGEWIWEVDAEGLYTYSSPAVEKILGYSAEDLVGKKHLYDLFAEDIRSDLTVAAFAAFAQKLTIQKFVHPNVHKNGQTVILETNGLPIVNEDGHLLGYRGTDLDITERKQAVDKLQEDARELADSKSMLVQILESIPVRVFWKDRDLEFMGCNTLFAQDAGFDRTEEVLARTDYEMGWKDQADRYRADDQEVMRSGCSKLNIVEPQTTPDGREIWLKTSKVPLRSSDGDVWGVLGLYEDFTERKRVEELLHASNAHLSNALRIAKLGPWEYDFKKDIFTFNDEFYAIFHTTAEQVGGYTMSSKRYAELFVHPDDLRLVGEEIQRSIETNDPHYDTQLEHRIVYADGSIGYIAVRFQIEKDANGETVRSYGVNQDITDRVRAEKERELLESQLRQAQKLETIGTLAGGIAHDFNNILTPILAYSEMAVDDLQADHPVRNEIEQVVRSAYRARDLVKQILTFSRQNEQQRFPLDPAPIVKEALKLLRASIPSTIDIQQTVDSQCGMIQADPSQVHQVLMNLCTNAYQAMRDGGTLSVGLGKCTVDDVLAKSLHDLTPGDYVRLSVTDTGCGMDERTRERIFEPFFTTKQVGEGTGLGLSVVHGIVSKHEGAIAVHSEVGHGTTFDVYFPIARVSQHLHVEDDRPVRGGNERILIVDDELTVAETSKIVLDKFGYSTTLRTSGQEARELFRQNPQRFDLVIADQTMPHLPGDHLAKEMMALRADIPVILITGFSNDMDEERCHQLGICRLLLKPLLPVELARAVRSVLDEAHAKSQTT